MTAGQVPAPPPPDDVRQLEQEISATRERLGEAVEELVAKLDVKSQARAQVSRLSRELSGRARAVRIQATAGASRARGQLAGSAAQAKGQLTSGAAHASAAAQGAPSAARQAAGQRQVQLAAAGGLLAVLVTLIAVLLLRRRRNR